mmetsp:Transcript_117426/g.204494  ORF Transcript_117426/g.204494 Transcript_117426/m.204494 type:complete len:154 (-) Transcript_117426:603-1064(-)
MPVWLAPAVLTLYGGAFVAPYFLTRQARKVNYWHPEAEAVEYVPMEPEDSNEESGEGSEAAVLTEVGMAHWRRPGTGCVEEPEEDTGLHRAQALSMTEIDEVDEEAILESLSNGPATARSVLTAITADDTDHTGLLTVLPSGIEEVCELSPRG